MSRKTMTLDEFRRRFKEIRDMGFVKSTRRGPTGVGHTFETLLGLKEDNIAMPDLGEVEVKARRAGSGSMVTLFTYDKGCWKEKQLEAIRKYGKPDKDGRLGMYFTMSRKPNSSGLYLEVDEEAATVKHTSGTVVASWRLETLAEQFARKFPALIVVSALSEMRPDGEYFHFTRTQLLKDTSAGIMRARLAEGNILLDLRLHDKGSCARNHGTGLRAFEGNLPLLFKDVTDL